MSDEREALSKLLAIMARLRDPQDGCPWDREQTFASIAPHTIEEAYEVEEAIGSGDSGRLRDELGDLLFQVVFLSRLAEERGWFDFDGVAEAIGTKLTRRHPHVFGDARIDDAQAQTRSWEALKASERAAAGAEGALAGVPPGLPALTRAAKLGRRAARVGFDWPDAPSVRLKVDEELDELQSALSSGESSERVGEELGDLMFALAQWSRHLGHDPEGALRAASRKFESRFSAMEKAARARGVDTTHLTAAEWEALWTDIKRT